MSTKQIIEKLGVAVHNMDGSYRNLEDVLVDIDNVITEGEVRKMKQYKVIQTNEELRKSVLGRQGGTIYVSERLIIYPDVARYMVEHNIAVIKVGTMKSFKAYDTEEILNKVN